MNLTDFHFLRPYWLLGLIAVAVLLWWFARRGRASHGWEAVCDQALWPHILIYHKDRRRHWPLYALGAAGMLSILALAGPAWERFPQPLFRDQLALVIALDLSRSMDAVDINPNRLQRARFKVADLLRHRREGQTALIVFAAQAFSVTPLTNDTATITAQLPVLSTDLMPAQGSQPAQALELAAALFKQAGISKGEVLLITDGINDRQFRSIIALLSAWPHRLSILGVGTPEGAPIPESGGSFLKDSQGNLVVPTLDESRLRTLAQMGGGIYQTVTIDDRDVDALLRFFKSSPLALEVSSTELQTEQWRDQGPWLLLLSLPLAILAFRRGYLAVLMILILPWPQPARAMEWVDLWLRRDQQAVKLFEAGEARQAAELFTNPAWQAAAYYRARDYEQALKVLGNLEGPEALYNKGNALARLGRYQEAIQSYEQVLSLDPSNADARYNRDLLRQLLRIQGQEIEKGQGHERRDPNPAESEGRAQEQPGSSADQPGTQDHNTGLLSKPQPSTDELGQGSGESPSSREEATSEPRPAKLSQTEGSDPDNREAQPTAHERSQHESLLANEQWLRRIPDDPGGLLRRKFYYYYRLYSQGETYEDPW